VLADIAAGRAREIPARRYDPDRAAALERAEELAAAQPPSGYETDYPEGFIRRGSFGGE
jgi:hypothetical protein